MKVAQVINSLFNVLNSITAEKFTISKDKWSDGLKTTLMKFGKEKCS